MTKQEVKDLGEGDARLQWWAMVLFAEVCDIVQTGEDSEYEAKTMYPCVIAKTRE